jgi:hypothetical protein
VVGEAASHFALRGLLRDVLCTPFVTAPAPGDTLSVDGVTYTNFGNTLGYLVNSGSGAAGRAFYLFVSQAA